MFQDKFVLADGTAIKESIVGVSWSTSSNSDSDITPGSVCASAVEIELWVSSDSALSVTQGTVLTYYKVDTEFGIETKLGVFTCDKPEKTGANKYKVTAYDNVTLLDVDVTEWLNSLAFPITIKDFAAALAAKCGLELANEPRLNKDYQVQKFTGSGVKARDLMKMVCSASGCFCNADADGKLLFDWYKKNKDVSISISKSADGRYFYLFDVLDRNLDDNVERALITSKASEESTYEIPYFANQLTFSDFTVKAIDKVQVKQSDDDVGVIYPADAQGTNALVIQGNQLLSATSDEALRPYVKNLYDGLNNITYVPCSNIQTPETLDIKVGDIVTVSDGKRQFETWITSVKHSGNRCTFESVGNANRNTTTAVNDTKYNARQKMAEIKTSIDRISTKLSEYSTTEEMKSAIEQTATRISLEVSAQMSGRNLLKYQRFENLEAGTKHTTTTDGVLTISFSASETDTFYIEEVADTTLWNLTRGRCITISGYYKITKPFQSDAARLFLRWRYKSGTPQTSYTTQNAAIKADVASADWIYYEKTYTTEILDEELENLGMACEIIPTKAGTDGQIQWKDWSLKISTPIQNGTVRSKFAMDASSVTIDTGRLTFNSNTIVINSTNFKLDASGNVKAKGTFESGDEQSGGYACIKNGTLELKYNGDTNLYFANTISGSGYADMHICGPGGQDAIRLQARSDNSGSGLFMFDKTGTQKTLILGDGTASFGNNVHIGGDLNMPEDYNHNLYLRRSKLQPCNGQNSLYCKWVSVNGADGNTYWALCGFADYQGT